MPIEIKTLSPDDRTILQKVAPDVFDNPIDPRLAAEFLRDRRHHLVVALDGDVVVGFASGVDYIHPDKPEELWINEVAVAPGYRRQGIGKRMLAALLECGRAVGCREAWVLTERSNPAAMRLDPSAGGSEDPGGIAMYSFPIERS